MAAPKKISLLPQEGFEYTTLGRVVTWSLATGRIIVVITELVVISAFLSRFWLDRRLTDLNEKIEEGTALVKTYQNLEKEWTRTQEKIEQFSILTKGSTVFNANLEAITQATPENIVLTQVTIDKEAIQISGLASFEGAVEGFMGNLSSLKIGDVELTNFTVLTSEQLGVKFTIVVKKMEVP